jgi:4a-hydroxytetrahydrobiopterin dehydratase
MARLSKEDVTRELAGLTGWDGTPAGISRVFKHKGFTGAMGFVTSVALLAERANHHPDIDIRWNTVTLTLSTHSEGGVTEKDIALAGQINNL